MNSELDWQLDCIYFSEFLISRFVLSYKSYWCECTCHVHYVNYYCYDKLIKFQSLNVLGQCLHLFLLCSVNKPKNGNDSSDRICKQAVCMTSKLYRCESYWHDFFFLHSILFTESCVALIEVSMTRYCQYMGSWWIYEKL